MSSTFQLDALAEILSRLPIDSVLRFRCVLKSWSALISTPEFAKLHSNHSLKTNSNRWLILSETEHFGYKRHSLYCLHIDSLNSSLVTLKELNNPLKSCDLDTKVLGSCNGLLLISNYVHDTGLWNPCTGEFKKLPFVGLAKDDGHIRFGFGYDVVNDDYKVVRIAQFFGLEIRGERGPFCSQVNVYSLKSNSWKKVEDFVYYVRSKEEPGTYLNGALHWVVSPRMIEADDFLHKQIIAFDLATEKCRVVPGPPHDGEDFTVKLMVLGGSLCVLHSFWDELFYGEWGNLDRALNHTDIWVMKDYGVKDSWTKITSIERQYEDVGRSLVPLAYSKSGEEILVEEDHKRFLWTSIKKGSSKIIYTEFGMIRGFLDFNSYVYSGSLVQLSSSDDDSSYLKKQSSQDKGGQRKTLKNRRDDFLSKGFKLKL